MRGLLILVAFVSIGCSSSESPTRIPLGVTKLAAARVSDELPVGAPNYFNGEAYDVGLAAGPDGYLVTYTLPSIHFSTSAELTASATRIGPNGEILDRFGIALGSRAKSEVPSFGIVGRHMYPVATWVGSAWLVVWAEPDGGLTCVRISEDGAIERPTARPGLSMVPHDIAFDGSGALVLANDGSAALLDAACNLAGDRVDVVPQSSTQHSFNLAFDGTSFLVAYTTQTLGAPDAFMIRRISSSGLSLGEPMVVATASWLRTVTDTEGYVGVEGNVASGAAGSLLAYSPRTWDPGQRNAPLGDPRYRLLSGDSLGAERTLASATGRFVEATATDDGFAIAARGVPQPLVLVTIDSNGNESGRATTGPDAGYSDVTLAGRGKDTLLAAASNVWVHHADGSRVGPNPITTQAESQFAASVAGAGGVRWVIWNAGSPSNYWNEESFGIYGTRISPAGADLDLAPTALFTGPGLYQPLANVASNGSDFLVAARLLMNSTPLVVVRRLFADGSVETRSVTISESAFPMPPRIATDGSGYLVVWLEYFEGAERLVATRMTSDAVALDVPPLVLIDENQLFQRQFDVAFDGTDYVVASSGWGGLVSEHIRLQWISHDGSVSQSGTSYPGKVCGLAWGRDRGVLTYYDGTLRAAVVRGRGAAATFRDLPSGASMYPIRAPVVWDGRTFWTIWTDNRRGFIDGSANINFYAADVYASRLSPDAEWLDSGGVLLSLGRQGNRTEPIPTLSGAGGRALAVYSVWDDRHGYRAFRLRSRVLTDDSPDPGAGGEGGAGGSAGAPERGGSGGIAGTAGDDGGTGATAGDRGDGTGNRSSGGRPGSSGAGGLSGESGESTAGNSGATEPTTTSEHSTPDEGCSCRFAGRSSSQDAAGIVLLLLMLRRRLTGTPRTARAKVGMLRT